MVELLKRPAVDVFAQQLNEEAFSSIRVGKTLDLLPITPLQLAHAKANRMQWLLRISQTQDPDYAHTLEGEAKRYGLESVDQLREVISYERDRLKEDLPEYTWGFYHL